MNQISLYYIHNIELSRQICLNIYSQVEKNDHHLSIEFADEIMTPFVTLGDKEFIKSTIKYLKARSFSKIFINYLEAIDAFMHDKVYWIDSFNSISEDFKKNKIIYNRNLDLINNISNISNISKTYSYLDKFFIQFKRSRLPVCLNASLIGVVSCDIGYFKIFGKNFIEDFFKFNTSELKIFIQFNSNTQVDQYQNLINYFRKKYCNLDICICVNTKNNAAVSSAILRFQKSLDLMSRRRCQIVILDIDCRPKMDFNNFFIGGDFDLALHTTKSGYPWERYSAGIILFQYSYSSLLFLNLLNAYVKDVLEESVTWTADQTAIAIVMFYLEHKKESIKVKSINPEAEKLIRSISRHSAKAKIKIKKRNLENLDY
jgi:hypothetical protein